MISILMVLWMWFSLCVLVTCKRLDKLDESNQRIEDTVDAIYKRIKEKQ